MNVLIGCEESGVVRRMYRDAGHNAISNDLLPSRDNSPYHLQCDVFDAVNHSEYEWDLIILHWPCTETCLAGNRYWARTNARIERAIGAGRLLNCATKKCKRVALEQPMSMIGEYIGPPTQRTNLNMFGEPETKSIWLWLFGLPKLIPTKIMTTYSPKVHFESPQVIGGLTRAQRRSETRIGLAKAFVAQWT